MIGHLTAAMRKDFDQLAARAAPAVFVVLWSTGFVATKYVLRSAEPLTYLAIRMAVVVAIMAVIAVLTRPRWPDRMGVVHSVIAGILVHGFYLGGTAVAIAHSIPAGLSAHGSFVQDQRHARKPKQQPAPLQGRDAFP